MPALHLEGTSVRREPPASVVRALRAVDPKAQLVHLGGKLWWLGVEDPKPEPTKLAGEIRDRHLTMPVQAQNELSNALRLEMLNRCAAGFRPIAIYEADEPGREIVEDFRERDFNWRHRREQTFRERLKDSDIYAGLEERMAKMRDFIQSEGKSIWHYALGRRRSFRQRVAPLHEPSLGGVPPTLWQLFIQRARGVLRWVGVLLNRGEDER